MSDDTGFTVEKANAAFKKAREIALTGTREERSGRFLARDASAGNFVSVSSQKRNRSVKKSSDT